MHLRQRRDFFYQLGELLGAGIPWSAALERLASAPSGSASREALLAALRSLAEPSAPPVPPPPLAGWEWGLLQAGQRTGRLPQSVQAIAQELTARQHSRQKMLRLCGYPLLVAHLAVLLLAIPCALLQGSWSCFFTTVASVLALFWAVLLGAWFGGRALTGWARRNVGLDYLLRSVPLFGTFWQAHTGARWAIVLGWIFRSGGGILGGLPWAAAAADTAGAYRVSQRMEERLRAGRSLAEAATDEEWLPAVVREGLWTGEQSGRLAEEMDRAAEGLREQAETALASWSRWVPRAFYGAVLVFAAWRILDWAVGYYRTIGQLLNG